MAAVAAEQMHGGADRHLHQLVRVMDLTADAAAVCAGIDVDAGIVNLHGDGIARIDTGKFPEVAGNTDSALRVNESVGLGLHLLIPFCFLDVGLLCCCCVLDVIIPE